LRKAPGLEYLHQPVLVRHVVTYLVHRADGIYVDGTVGTGGHSLAIAKNLRGKGRLICLDKDTEAVGLARKRLAFPGERVLVVKANYADLDKVLEDREIKAVDGVLLDLGMSSHQLESSGRGFSFSKDEHLDMRMDPDDVSTAHHLVNSLSQRELETLLKDFGEERMRRPIARAIVRARTGRPIETSKELAALIKSVIFPSRSTRARHPATRTFQALRIAVNRELQNLETFLNKIPLLLAKRGRLVAISYHSLEDRLVKRAMSEWERPCTCPPDFPQCVCGKVRLFKRLFKGCVKPDRNEIGENPRSRSARLRAAERV